MPVSSDWGYFQNALHEANAYHVGFEERHEHADRKAGCELIMKAEDGDNKKKRSRK